MSNAFHRTIRCRNCGADILLTYWEETESITAHCLECNTKHLITFKPIWLGYSTPATKNRRHKNVKKVEIIK